MVVVAGLIAVAGLGGVSVAFAHGPGARANTPRACAAGEPGCGGEGALSATALGSAGLPDAATLGALTGPVIDGAAQAVGLVDPAGQGAEAVLPLLETAASVETVLMDLEQALGQLGSGDPLGSVLRVLGPLTQRGPFDMLGATWDGAADSIRARVHSADGWGEWFELERGDEQPDAAESGDGSSGTRTSSEPTWVGTADGYELEVPAGVSGVLAHLVRAGEAPAAGATAAFAQPAGAPPVNLRDAWGARPARTAASYAPSVRMAFVHHTTNSNGYDQSDVPAMLRAIQAYHQDANGWSDICYNFIVDRFGTVWQGRDGDINGAVIAAHTGGFNTGSVGVSVIGNFTSADPSPAAVEAVGRVVGWKLGTNGVDPYGTTNMRSAGNDRYPAGSVVNFNNASGHMDAKPTACPARLYSRLGDIRALAAQYRQPASPAPPAPPLTPAEIIESILDLLPPELHTP
ncbi:hypothetical protein BH18ACT4_BH18ACT4_01430 [soil metagenome]